MAQVKIFVEVRSGSDNRSEAIKKKIYETGAEIHDKIYRDTTHVVFREGLQSVYNKAKMMKIPVVNLLWIEDCKKYRKVVDPSKYTISDLDRYENPDMYKKIRRQKSMQPDYKFDYISNKLVYKSDKRASIGKYKTPSATAMTSSEESLNNLIGDNEKETLDSASKVTIQETFDVIDASSQSSVCDSLDEYVKVSNLKIY